MIIRIHFRCAVPGCAEEHILDEGQQPAGWTQLRSEVPFLWLCQAHQGKGLDALNRALSLKVEAADRLGMFRARIEMLVQWAEEQHHSSFSDAEMVSAVERYARAALDKKESLQ